MSRPTVAAIGLGAMGLPMATWLVCQQFPVRAFDIAQARLNLAVDAGVQTFPAAREAAAGADVVLVAVRNQEQLESLLWGSDGIAEALAPGAVVLLTSTIGIQAVQDVAARLAVARLELVDAPVSGGPVRAGKGDLLMTAGATDAAWAVAEPVMDALASTLVRIGDQPGDGQKMKTVKQLLCGVHIAAAAEALALAGELGLDKAKALETLMAGAAASFILGDRGQRIPGRTGEAPRSEPARHLRQGHGHRERCLPLGAPGRPGGRGRRAALGQAQGKAGRRRLRGDHRAGAAGGQLMSQGYLLGLAAMAIAVLLVWSSAQAVRLRRAAAGGHRHRAGRGLPLDRIIDPHRGMGRTLGSVAIISAWAPCSAR